MPSIPKKFISSRRLCPVPCVRLGINNFQNQSTCSVQGDCIENKLLNSSRIASGVCLFVGTRQSCEHQTSVQKTRLLHNYVDLFVYCRLFFDHEKQLFTNNCRLNNAIYY